MNKTTEKNSKMLTKEEIAFLVKVSEKILAPIDGKVTISDTPTTIHCLRGEGGFDRTKWDEYIYRISINSKNGTAELCYVFNDFSLVAWAWHIAADAFHRLDDDIHGPVAENLWPSDNSYKPDYERFIEKNEN